MATSGLTKDDEIVGRAEAARIAYQPMQTRYKNNCTRFRDSMADVGGEEVTEDERFNEDTPREKTGAVGAIPHLRTNIYTKLATICGWRPDWRFKMGQGAEDLQQLALEGAKQAWKLSRALVRARRAAVNRYVGTKGIVAYGWNEEQGPFFSAVRQCDFAPDPYVTDWDRLRFATRTIQMPPDRVRKLYPKFGRDLFATNKDNPQTDAMRSNAVELTLYWDDKTEAVLWQKKVLSRDKNHYGKPPFLFFDGDIDPESAHDTGEYDHAYPMQYLLNVMEGRVKDDALHGGTITLYDAAAFDTKTKEKFGSDEPLSMLPCKGDMEDAIKRVEAPSMNPALLAGYQMFKQAHAEAVGVTSTQLGTASDVKFATQEAAINNLAGARTNDEREKWEALLTEMMETLLSLILQFEEPQDEASALLMEAFANVASLEVVESSTLYKDPIALRQDAQTVLDESITVDQYLAGIGSMKRINVEAAFNDFLRAHDKRDTKEYWYEIQPMLTAPTSPSSTGAMPGEETQPGIPPQAVQGELGMQQPQGV